MKGPCVQVQVKFVGGFVPPMASEDPLVESPVVEGQAKEISWLRRRSTISQKIEIFDGLDMTTLSFKQLFVMILSRRNFKL